MQLETADLRHGRETLDAIDLQVRLAIAGDLDQFRRFEAPDIAWR